MTPPVKAFRDQRRARIAANAGDLALIESSRAFLLETIRAAYSYNFEWLSRPIIQYPQDMIALQEIIWRVCPDLVIETGIAHGGSLIFSASILSLLDYRDAVAAGTVLDPRTPKRKVLGIDIDIRPHNREAIETHPMASRITLLQGSSIAPEIVDQARTAADRSQRILVCLDSNHTHDHVLAELKAYAPLVSSGSYCVVFDTVIEQLPEALLGDRPWTHGNSPMTAVESFLSALQHEHVVAADGERLQFEPDREIDSKLLISVAPRGYLRRVPQVL